MESFIGAVQNSNLQDANDALNKLVPLARTRIRSELEIDSWADQLQLLLTVLSNNAINADSERYTINKKIWKLNQNGIKY